LRSAPKDTVSRLERLECHVPGLRERFPKPGAEVRFFRRPIDPDDPSGRLLATNLSCEKVAPLGERRRERGRDDNLQSLDAKGELKTAFARSSACKSLTS
jgi:hypothetical protein